MMETHVNGHTEPQPRPIYTAPMFTDGKVEPIPASIVQAICKVQSTIEAVKKSGYNQNGKYKFASADDIYAAIAVKLAQTGLVIYPLELSRVETHRVEKEGKVSQWAKFHFGYVLATADDTWFDPRSSRSLFIQIIGPQTFNAAESYCQKSYLRALFKLPTGDMDLDSLPQDGEVPKKKKTSAESKRDGTDKRFNLYRQQIAACTTRDELHECKGAWLDETADWPDRWLELCQEDWDVKYEGLPE